MFFRSDTSTTRASTISFNINRQRTIFGLCPLQAKVSRLRGRVPILFPNDGFGMYETVLHFRPTTNPRHVFRHVKRRRTRIYLNRQSGLQSVDLGIRQRATTLHPTYGKQRSRIHDLILTMNHRLTNLCLKTSTLSMLLHLLSPTILSTNKSMLRVITRIITMNTNLLLKNTRDLSLPRHLTSLRFRIIPNLFRLTTNTLLYQSPRSGSGVHRTTRRKRRFRHHLVTPNRGINMSANRVVRGMTYRQRCPRRGLRQTQVPNGTTNHQNGVTRRCHRRQRHSRSLSNKLRPISTQRRHGSRRYRPTPRLATRVYHRRQSNKPRPFSTRSTRSSNGQRVNSGQVRLLRHHPTVRVNGRHLRRRRNY